MKKNAFKLTIHMVSSLDGMIAKKDNSISWFETVDYYENGITLTEQETSEFLKSIDCYVMGYRTYEHALNFQYLTGGFMATFPSPGDDNSYVSILLLTRLKILYFRYVL